MCSGVSPVGFVGFVFCSGLQPLMLKWSLTSLEKQLLSETGLLPGSVGRLQDYTLIHEEGNPPRSEHFLSLWFLNHFQKFCRSPSFVEVSVFFYSPKLYNSINHFVLNSSIILHYMKKI